MKIIHIRWAFYKVLTTNIPLIGMEVSRMIPQKFGSASASRVAAPSELVASLQAEILTSEGLSRPQEASARTGGIRFFYRAVADELSR